MSNMSYCRYRNTLSDLRDCYEALGDDDLSEDEVAARRSLVDLCRRIVREAEDLALVEREE